MVNKKAEMEKLGASAREGGMGNDLAKYQNEINIIKRTAIVSSDKIIIKQIVDHKNISLWTKWGKRIGPMHRDNAIRTFEMFWNRGVQLSTQQPSPETVEAWKQSDEGKAHYAAHEARRAIKDKSRKSGSIEKLARQIAAMSGLTEKEVTNIVPAKSLAEGQARLGKDNVAPATPLDGGDGVGGVIAPGSLSNMKAK